MPTTISHGVPIYYEVQGTGPAVLFCHGAGSNAATWWQQIPVFAKEFTCVTYDHRCFGRSTAPQNEFIPDYFVADALAVLDAAGVDKAALVCQSLGGLTGLRLALSHPERVTAFISCDSPLGIQHPELNENLLDFLASVPVSDIENRALSAGFISRNPLMSHLYSQINQFNPLSRATDQRAEWSQRISGLFHGEHLVSLEDFATLECPTLFVVGEEDRAVPPWIVKQLSAIVNGSELLVIANAGHSPYFEQPEAFNSSVLDFLHRSHSSVLV